jgi:hypothetical protein
MSKTTSRFFSLCLAPTLVWGLAACGGGGGSSGGMMGQMALSVADAPVDGAQHVVVEFTGVELVPNSGNPVNITFSMPKSIDLITQSGTASAQLFSQPIAAGTYGQIRLTVMADGDPSHSYMVLSDGTMHGLLIPSGAETGLKLVNDFTVGSSGVTDYSIDFDLRKAITCPPGQAPACILKPVERLVDNTTVGNIQGTVAMALIPMGCTPAVYLYSGAVTMPEDYNSMASAGDMNQPIASKVPALDQAGDYYYQFTFLSPGSYSLAYTCQASMDNPDQADAAVLFTSTPVKSGIGVAAGQTVGVNFP